VRADGWGQWCCCPWEGPPRALSTDPDTPTCSFNVSRSQVPGTWLDIPSLLRPSQTGAKLPGMRNPPWRWHRTQGTLRRHFLSLTPRLAPAHAQAAVVAFPFPGPGALAGAPPGHWRLAAGLLVVFLVPVALLMHPCSGLPGDWHLRAALL